MPQENISLAERLYEYGVIGYIWIFFISIWAGTAKYLMSLDGQKPTLIGWLTRTVVSGFVGVITAMVCQYYQFDFLLTAALTGVAAHNGTNSLSILSQMIRKNNAPLIPSLVDDEKKKGKDSGSK